MIENGKNEINENKLQNSVKSSFNINQVKTISNKLNNEIKKDNSIKEKTYNNIYNSFDNIDENPNQVVSKILDNINKNSLSTFYDSDSEFKNKIDSLNLKFYLETEKYLSNQNKKIKTQTSLFIILFKQIIIYIEEIERLNLIIIQKKYKPENIIKRTDDITQKQKEFQTKEDIINALKKSQSNMEAKLLQALINENNLNKKIEILQKEIERYKKKLTSGNNNSGTNANIIDNSKSNSFKSDNKENLSEKNNNDNNYRSINNLSNNIKINKKKNSHNSICFTNSTNNQITTIIKINKSINIKSKSPNSFNTKKSSIKLQNFKNLNDNNKRNHSEKDENLKINNNKNNNLINSNNIKQQNIDEMKLGNYLINDLNKNEKSNTENKKSRHDKLDKNNTIDITENELDLIKRSNFKKIVINDKFKLNKDDNIILRNTKKNGNNLKINLLLSNSNLSNNINRTNKKTKNEFNMNKCVYTCYNTITNYNNKYKTDNTLNYFKLSKNGRKGKIYMNINNQSNNKANNKNGVVEQKSKSSLKNKESNKNKIKNIINISSTVDTKKDNNNQNKKI